MNYTEFNYDEAIMRDGIDYLLKDKRLCKSNNMQEYFKNKKNQIFNDAVIRVNGTLYFAFMQDYAIKGWWAGVRVVEVACQGKKAIRSEDTRLRKYKPEDVTEWFWGLYRERGIVSIPEIWHREIPKQLSHREYSTL